MRVVQDTYPLCRGERGVAGDLLDSLEVQGNDFVWANSVLDELSANQVGLIQRLLAVGEAVIKERAGIRRCVWHTRGPFVLACYAHSASSACVGQALASSVND